MRITPCTSCKGQRLKPSSLAVTVADKNIYEMTSMSVKELVKFLADIELTERSEEARQAFQAGKPSESGLPRR